jgi:hypothetical protein
MADFQAHCSECRATVAAFTILDNDGVRRALASNEKILVMHTVTAPDGTSKDHSWDLGNGERENLRRHLEHEPQG